MTEKKKSAGWRLQDVLLMAMLGLLFGLVYLGIFYLGLALQTALTPAGLGPFAFEIVYGIWFWARRWPPTSCRSRAWPL